MIWLILRMRIVRERFKRNEKRFVRYSVHIESAHVRCVQKLCEALHKPLLLIVLMAAAIYLEQICNEDSLHIVFHLI